MENALSREAERTSDAECRYREILGWNERQAQRVRFAEESCGVERGRYGDLLDKYHALKLEGASLPLPPAAKAPPDVVTQAIIAQAKNNRALLKHYAEYAAEQRRANVSEEDIAAAIREGQENVGGVIA